ncbi:DUF72 domain-containing protein [bacterium]|nr:DUF72 domain-containing protein [bacterium]
MPDPLRIGTCSWKYPSWAGIVYSSPKPADYLREYAARFDTVEIDQWFWSLFPGGTVRLPDPADVSDYAASVPAGFRFSIKVPNALTLTHYYQQDRKQPLTANPHFLSPSVLDAFLERIAPLGEKAGPLMFQFEYLNTRKMPDQDTFLKRLDTFFRATPPGRPYGIEIRNPGYLDRAFFVFLAERGLIPVFLQGYYMPPVPQVLAAHKDLLSGTVVIRLHGPDRAGIEAVTKKQWNRIAAPKDAELTEIIASITGLIGQGLSIYLNVNNHYEGSAPLTIEKIRNALES